MSMLLKLTMSSFDVRICVSKRLVAARLELLDRRAATNIERNKHYKC